MACRDSSGAKCSGTWTASAEGVMALSESFIKLLVAGDQKASLPVFLCSSIRSGTERVPLLGVLLCCSAIRHIEGSPWLGSYSVDQCARPLKGYPGWGPTL